jgi:hypothetical protein
MPYTATDHQETQVIELSAFTGGINSGIPPTQIADNECTAIYNMFMDRTSGRLRTRYPIIKYSNTAAPGIVYNMHYWKGKWILATTDRKIYYLDSSKDPQPLGELNGSSRPCFCPFNDKLIVASGALLQYISISGTTPQAIANVTGAPKASYVFQQVSRLVTSGDEDNVDRLQQCNYFDDSIWTATDYGDVGYLDDTSVVGILEAFEGTFIIFKRGYGGLKTYYATSLDYDTPLHKLAADGHSVRSHAGAVHVLGRVFVMEEHCVSALVGTDTYGNILYDQNPGLKLSNAFDASVDCFGTHYPRDAQIWFVPDPKNSSMFVYHYHLNAWTRFTFGSRKVYCAYYDPVGDYMYLGCDDGYIYKYDYTSMAYADTSGAYTSRLTTKMFAKGVREMVLKSPRLIWTTLAAGSGTLKVNTDYGQTATTWGTLTTSAPQMYVYNTQDAAITDLATYTEVDTPGVLTGASSTITAAACLGTTESYVYYDYTATPFSGDFSVRFSVNMNAASVNNSVVYAWGLSNYVDDLYASAITNKYATYYVKLTAVADTGVVISGDYVSVGGSPSDQLWYIGSEATEYVVEMIRDYSASTLTMNVYNSTMATRYYSQSIACGAETMNYMYAFSSYKSGSTYSWSGTVGSVYTSIGMTPVYVYDTRAGGNDEMYVWPETLYEEKKGDYNQPTESFQFDIALTSGAFMVERLVAEISSSRRA